ncbi:23S rRNA (uracil(1939)-C(5))-methyltransferase RlmD [Calderihabitans maritimus]|nr:23S rRNA (uracil(1939)-C(5))-methyltransferase RlmD [Calderihabitans maritimus]
MASGVPVSVGQEVEICIDNINHQGEGVGRYRGFALFVPYTVPGEKILARVIQVKKNYARGELVEVLEKRRERVLPRCHNFGRCGGCHLQHIDYPSQLKIKRELVQEALRRIGGLQDVLVHPVIGMKEPWYYRNRVQLHVGERNGELVIGFYAPGTRRLVEAERCLLFPPELAPVIERMKQLFQHCGIKAYRHGKGILRHLVLKKSRSTGEVMLVVVTYTNSFPGGEMIAEKLMAEFPEVVSVLQNVNRSRSPLVLGPRFRLIKGKETIREKIGPFQFLISAPSFFQVNPEQTEILYHKVVEYIEPLKPETVVDVYCGTGTIAIFLSQTARKIIGIETVAAAVEDARVNAALNRVHNCEFRVGTAEEVIPELEREQLELQAVVLDPPRRGCDRRVLGAVARLNPRRIIYVSCDPATLARDLKILQELGYHARQVQPVDMFPHTYHIETVAQIDRLK